MIGCLVGPIYRSYTPQYERMRGDRQLKSQSRQVSYTETRKEFVLGYAMTPTSNFSLNQ